MMGFLFCPKCKRVILPSEQSGLARTKEGFLLNDFDKKPIKIEDREEAGPDLGWS
jgi:hypothetical protein